VNELEVRTEFTPLAFDLQRGAAIARQLRDYIAQARMTVRMRSGGEHVRIEGWQVLCHLCQLPLPSIVSVRREERENGYCYIAEAVLQHGGREYRAYGLCSSTEPNWANKPEFQLMSMAQTRAAGKVLRLLLGWIVTLAGYEPTPAEEMVIEDPSPDRGNAGGAQQQAQSQRQRREESENPELPETRELARAHLNAEVPRAWLQTPGLLETRELARAHLNAEAMRAVLQRYGVEHISALRAEQLTELRRRLQRVADGETLAQVFPEVFESIEMDPYFDREPESGSSEGNGHDREAEMRLSELQQADRQRYNRTIRALQAQARQRFADDAACRQWLHANYGKWSFRDLTLAEAQEALQLMRQGVLA
jgi:hypothetical protein